MKNKEYMEWDKNLISEINVQSKIERYIEDDFDFDELDSSKPIKFNYSSDYSNEEDKVFIWNDYLFYAYRRSKEYNYIKLRTLDEKEENIKTKICGKDFYGNNLYYPIYEKCPINFIEINYSPSSSLNSNYKYKSIQMGYKFLHYSNEYIEGYPFYGLEINDNYKISCDSAYQRFPTLYNIDDCELFLTTPLDNTLIDYEEEAKLFDDNKSLKGKSQSTYVKLFTSVYAKNYDQVFDYDTNKKLKIFKYYLNYSKFLSIAIIVGLIFLFLILIMIICYGCKKMRHGKLGIFLFYLYLFYMISFIPLFVVKINVDYSIEHTFLHFLHIFLLFFPLIILLFNFSNIKTKRCKICGKAFVVFLLLVYLIFNLIINGIQLTNGKLDKGRFEDFYNTFTKTPIIDLQSSYNEENELGKIKYSDDIKSEPYETKLYYWEGQTFEITRAPDEYTYSYMLKYENDKKKCGVDLVGNPLYLPNNIKCPINYIEITNNNLPPNNEKIFTTISLGSNKYLHYSNEYTDNQMIYDLRISDEIPPYTSTESYNALCFSIYIYGYKYCNFGKNYYDYEGISGYSEIDKEL